MGHSDQGSVSTSQNNFPRITLMPRRFGLKPMKTGTLFQMQAVGHELPAELPTDLEGIRKLFRSISNRDDIIIDKAEWVSEWRCVHISIEGNMVIHISFVTEPTSECAKDSETNEYSWLAVRSDRLHRFHWALTSSASVQTLPIATVLLVVRA